MIHSFYDIIYHITKPNTQTSWISEIFYISKNTHKIYKHLLIIKDRDGLIIKRCAKLFTWEGNILMGFKQLEYNLTYDNKILVVKWDKNGDILYYKNSHTGQVYKIAWGVPFMDGINTINVRICNFKHTELLVHRKYINDCEKIIAQRR